MCRLCAGIPKRETIQAVVTSIIFGIFLPSFDVGSDIRVSVRLFLNGHPRWALSVLTPVLMNTFFSAIACRELERKKSGGCWIMYLPLVLIQVYPQFCTIRLLFEFYHRKMSLIGFVSKRDSMDGGIGCLEPYCESVLQVFVQTALFSHVHSIDPLISKLCISTSDELAGDCEVNLSELIYDLDDETMYNDLHSPIRFNKSSLSQEYNATLDDLKLIQMHKLVIGNYSMFASTYAISIAAACYGITKFFRLSHARMATRIFTLEFAYITLISAAFLGMKGGVLAKVVMGHERSLLKGVWIWILFTKLPTTLMVLIFTIIVPCLKLYKRYPDMHFGIVAQMILKQPCLLLSPLVTPFFFTLNVDEEKIIDDIPSNTINGKIIKKMSTYSSYALSPRLSVINSIISIIFSSGLLLWDNPSDAVFFYLWYCIFGLSFFLLYTWHCIFLLDVYLPCVEHDILECPDCTRLYSFYGEAVMSIEACDNHEQAPYQYRTDINDCNKCSDIARRYVVRYYLIQRLLLISNSFLLLFRIILQ